MKNNLIHSSILIIAGSILTSCSIVGDRINDAREVPQASMTGIAASYDSKALMEEVMTVWQDEQAKVRRVSIHKLKLLPWIKTRIQESFQEYKQKKAIMKQNPEFSEAQYQEFIKSEAYNQTALNVANKIIESKEYRLKNADSLYYLLGTKATDEGIAIAQIGLNWEYLGRGEFQNFVTTETFTNGGNSVTIINNERKQVSGVNLLDDIMNAVDGDVSYSAMKARGITDTEITAFSAFVRFFSENENLNLPIIGAGKSDRGHRRKIYAALWAAMRATTLPVSPDGRLLTPPNGIRIEPIFEQSYCNFGNPLKDVNGINFYVCKLQAQGSNGELLGQDLRIKTYNGSVNLSGYSSEQAAFNNYSKARFGSASSGARATPRVDFKVDHSVVATSADFEKSDMEVYKTAIRQLGADGWDRIMGATISAARGGAVGAAFAAAIPGFTPAEGFALGIATNTIAYAFNSWIKKEKLSETQIAQSVHVVKALTAQADNAGIVMDKPPALWVIIPEGQSTPDGAPVESGVRLAWVKDVFGPNGKSTFSIDLADVSGAELKQNFSIRVNANSGMSMQELIGGQNSTSVSARYSPNLKVSKSRVQMLAKRYEGKSDKEVLQNLVKDHVDEQVSLNFPTDKAAFRAFMTNLVTAFAKGQWNKMDRLFNKEFGIEFSELYSVSAIEQIDVNAIAQRSKIFKDNPTGLKVYFASIKRHEEVKDEAFQYAKAAFEGISKQRKGARR